MNLLSSVAAVCGAAVFFSFLILACSVVFSVSLPGFIQSALTHAFVISLVIGLLIVGPSFLEGRR